MRGPIRSGHDDPERRTRSLGGIAAVLVVVILALVVVRKLQVRSILADCMAAQRPGCETMVEGLRISRQIDRLWDHLR